MIASRYPFWRTNPANFGVAGFLPILTGCLAVLIIASLLGFFLSGINIGAFTSSDVDLFTVCGVFFALFYWGAIRVLHPTTFGVAFRAAP